MANLIPKQTTFTLAPQAGVMDSRVATPPTDATAPAWASGMTIGKWYKIAGASGTDTGDGFTATNDANAIDPRNDPTTNANYPLAPAYNGTSGYAAHFNAWNSGIFAPTVGASGSLLFYGGGHRDYYGNVVTRFDLATRTFSRFKDPSEAGPFTSGAALTNGAYTDSTPSPPHTYSFLQYHAGTNSLVCLKSITNINAPDTGSASLALPWMLDLQTKAWRRGPLAAVNTFQAVSQGSGCVHPDGPVMGLASVATTIGNFGVFDPSTGANGDGTYGTWTLYDGPQGNLTADGSLVVDPTTRRVIHVNGITNDLILSKPLDSLTSAWTTVSVDTPPALLRQSPCEWSSVLGGIVYQPSGSAAEAATRTNVYLITSGDNWTSADFALLTTDANSHTLALPADAGGLFQRFRVCEFETTVLLVGVTRSTDGAYAMRLA